MRFGGWAALAAMGGCGGPVEGGCAPCGGCEPTLEVGLGADGFTPLPDGGTFPLVHGPQGGYHLDIGLRATHLDGSSLVTGHLDGTIDGERYAAVDPWLDLRCRDGRLESWGTRLVYEATPGFLDGKTTRIVAEVTDAAGNTVVAEATFVIRDTR